MMTRCTFQSRRPAQRLSAAFVFVVLACATDAVSGVDGPIAAARSKPSSLSSQGDKGTTQGKGMSSDQIRREILRRIAESRPQVSPTAVPRIPLPSVTTPRPSVIDTAQVVRVPLVVTTAAANQAQPSPTADSARVEATGGKEGLARILKSEIVDARKKRIHRLLSSLSFEFAT